MVRKLVVIGVLHKPQGVAAIYRSRSRLIARRSQGDLGDPPALAALSDRLPDGAEYGATASDFRRPRNPIQVNPGQAAVEVIRGYGRYPWVTCRLQD